MGYVGFVRIFEFKLSRKIIRLVSNKIIIRLIFVIVPMMNVDGVIFGNYRTGCAGRDLNR